MQPLFTHNLVISKVINETAIGIATKDPEFKKKRAYWQLSKVTPFILSMLTYWLVTMYSNLTEDKRTVVANTGLQNKGHSDSTVLKVTYCRSDKQQCNYSRQQPGEC